MSLETKEKIVTTITLANSMMGTSYLTLAYHFKRLGWPLGLFSILFCGAWTMIGFRQTVKAADAVQIGSLRKILETLFGKALAYVIDGAVCLEYIGYLICYVSVASDYFRLAIFNFSKGDVNPESWYMKLAFGGLFLILTFIKTLTCFSNIASFSMLFICITVISVVVYCIIAHVKGTFTINLYDDATQEYEIVENYPVTSWGELAAPESSNAGYVFLEFLMRLPMFQTLYGVYASVTAVYHDMQSSTSQKITILNKTTIYSSLIVIAIYSVNAICANALFGRDIASNQLLSFSPNDIWMTICRLLSCFSVSVSYVLIVYPVRTIILSWLPVKQNTKWYNISFYLIGLIIVFITVLLSILIPNIETVLNFISAIFGCVWYGELVAMLVFADPLIKAAKIDRQISELKEHKTEETREQEKENVINIINRRSSFVYELGDEHDEKMQQQIEKARRESVQIEDKKEEKQEENKQEEKQENNQETVEAVADQKPVIAVEQELDQELQTSQVMTKEDIEQEKELIKQKTEILKGMSVWRKVIFGIVTALIIAIHLESFIISTFGDITNGKLIK